MGQRSVWVQQSKDGKRAHKRRLPDKKPGNGVRGVSSPPTVKKPVPYPPVTQETLKTIQRMDPDGKPHRPTEEDYRNFKTTVVGKFGKRAWDVYVGEEWDPAPEYDL